MHPTVIPTVAFSNSFSFVDIVDKMLDIRYRYYIAIEIVICVRIVLQNLYTITFLFFIIFWVHLNL